MFRRSEIAEESSAAAVDLEKSQMHHLEWQSETAELGSELINPFVLTMRC